MPLLALDTASPTVAVAVADDTGVLAEENAPGRRHAELLAPAMTRALARAGVAREALTSVVVGTGPGPFTGLRVGLVTARVLGFTLGIPVLGVCTLDALAYAAAEDGADGAEGAFRVVTDARRREVYWAQYEAGRRTEGPHVGAPADAAWPGIAVGEGAALYPEFFPGHRSPLLPSAAALARHVLAGLPTEDPQPRYLRRPDATPGLGRKSVLA